MSLESGQSALTVAYAEFRRRWEAGGEHWRDSKREDFEAAYLSNLDGRVRAATVAMTDLAQLVRHIRRDCE